MAAGKRVLAALLALAVIGILPGAAFASGFYEEGGYSHTQMSFGFETEDAVLVFNKEAEEEPNLSEVWSGSILYIPIGVFDEDTGEYSIATDKQIKDYDVSVSYKATAGGQYIEDVTIENGKKAKQSKIQSGAHAKITFSSAYTGTRYGNIDMMLVLSVNKMSCQETRVNLVTTITNPSEEIDTNSVFSVKGPSQFEVRSSYNGEATFDFGDKITYTARVNRNGRYYLNLDRSENENIAAMQPKAHMQFYNFVGEMDTFASVGKLEIPIDKDKFKGDNGKLQIWAYEIINNQLYSMGTDVLTYDSRKSVLEMRTQTLGNYVLSNSALMQEVAREDEDVIQTGYATPATDTLAENGELSPVSQDTSQAETSVYGAQLPDEPEAAAEAAQAGVEPEDLTEEEDAELQEPEETQEPAVPSYSYNTVTTTGLEINVSNTGGYNPPTGYASHTGGAAALMGGALLALGLAGKHRRP